MAAILVLPLLGAVLGGRRLAQYFQFPPPLSIPTDYPRWSWWAGGLVLAPLAAIAWTWLGARRPPSAAGTKTTAKVAATRRWPSWGVIALAWTIAWWVLAWTRFAWFAPFQRYTFFPLWLGFIGSVNALTLTAGGAVVARRPVGEWLKLFVVSAGFWWVFEWLNRFVHNWHYLGVEDFGPLAYALHATLCFSTVLPAVTATSDLLHTRAGLQAALARGPQWTWFQKKPAGVVLLILGAAGLLLTGIRPLETYPALWAGPVALAMGLGVITGRPGVWSEMATGDWRRAGSWALAALVCGFCWELWNVHSAAKWIYTVPYVERLHVFEMPALGYLGYLPFGVECLMVVGACGVIRDRDEEARVTA